MTDQRPISVRACGVFAAISAMLAIVACERETPVGGSPGRATGNDSGTADQTTPAALLQAAIEDTARTPEERARDKWRHPAETLAFFGVKPDMTVVEVWPGAGWYTNILGPYLRAGGGELILATVDPQASDYARKAQTNLIGMTADPARFGDVRFAAFNPGANPAISPAIDAGADAVVTFRNLHNWIDAGSAGSAFEAMFAALKPGGVLGLVEHRAAASSADGGVHGGYVTEATAIALAEAAGFVLEGRSEINANPADDRDHPFGVWTLPPVSRLAPAPGLAPQIDAATFSAIGESDRMTLRFRKPAAAPDVAEPGIDPDAPETDG